MKQFQEYEISDEQVASLIEANLIERPIPFLNGLMTIVFGEEFRSTPDLRWIGPTYPNEEFEEACNLHQVTFDLHTPTIDVEDRDDDEIKEEVPLPDNLAD